MLIEFYNSILALIPVVLIAGFITKDFDKGHRDEILMQKAVVKLFFEGVCEQTCSSKEIIVADKKIKIRKKTKAFRKKSMESKDEILENIYSELEEAIETNTSK